MTFRIFATTDIGKDALQRLRAKGWELEVYEQIEPPPRTLILERVKGGVDALITTLRDKIDEEVFASGKAASLKVVAQDAVGFDNIDRAAANRHQIPFSNTADVLTDATAEFAFLIMGAAARMTWPSEQMVREQTWSTWHPYHPWLGDEVTGKNVLVVGTGRIGKSFIKKAVGFDMDVLCYDPAFQDAKFVESVRREAARALPVLVPFLSHSEPEIRSSVASAIGAFPDYRTTYQPVLKIALAIESDDEVRAEIAQNIARLNVT